MKSMTGFGSATATDTTTGIGLKAEISSINKKQLEIKLGLSRELTMYEIPLRSLVSEKIARGSITLRIDFLPGASDHYLDFDKLRLIYDAAKRFQEENNIPGEITISNLLALPDASAHATTDFSDPVYMKLLTEAVGKALSALVEMRHHEGEKLKVDLLKRIDIMEQTVAKIRPMAAKLPEQQKEKLLEKIKDLGIPVDANDERILKEAVIFADKLDVTEEITRLNCHFDHFRKLSASETAVGRSLDFLVQEIFRECNTLGTKAACAEISPLIVELKTELEKIREQVQNIE